MLNIARVLKPWKEAASLNAQINLYGFWDASTFLTKSGDLGVVLRVGGIDYLLSHFSVLTVDADCGKKLCLTGFDQVWSHANGGSVLDVLHFFCALSNYFIIQ